MKEKHYLDWIDLNLNKLIVFILLMATCFVLACLAFRQNVFVTGQERKDQQTVQQQVSDDASGDSSLPSFIYYCIDKTNGL